MKMLVSAVLLSAATVPFAAPSDGVNPIRGQIPVLGCELTFSMGPEVENQYGRYIRDSLPRITAYTGIRFTETTGGAADVRYAIDPTLPKPISDLSFHTLGMAHPDGSIDLADVNELSVLLDDNDSKATRINLITHETLHVLGLGHDMDIGSGVDSDEIMAMTIRTDNTVFGDGDKAGMEAIRQVNGCSIAGLPVPEDVYTPSVGASAGKVAAFLTAALIMVGIVVWVGRRSLRRRRIAARTAALDEMRATRKLQYPPLGEQGSGNRKP